MEKLRFSVQVITVVAIAITAGCTAEFDDWSQVRQGLSRCAGGTNGDLDYCDATCTCGPGEGFCQNDGECDPGLVCGARNGLQFGFPFNYRFCVVAHCENGTLDADETGLDCGGSDCGSCYCPLPNGHSIHCSPNCLCPAGEGDCDNDAECQAGLVCTSGYFERFGLSFGTDVCLAPHCSDGITSGDETAVDCGGSCGPCVCPGSPGDSNYCTPSCPCAGGAGDCNVDADCQSGLVCVQDAGESQGFPAYVDVCMAAHCTNGAHDGDETGIDCGGSCGNNCPPTDILNATQTDDEDQSNAKNYLFFDMSENGRYVVFASEGSNLVPGDTNGFADVFVRDTALGTTERMSTTSFGVQANSWSNSPSISNDGRYIAFRSAASNLVAGDTNGQVDIFIKDRVTGALLLVSNSSGGDQANGECFFPHISGNGFMVVYESDATNLVTGDTNGVRDVFVSARVGGYTIRASQSSAGTGGDGASSFPWIDDTGTHIVYTSLASNLVAGDENQSRDIFYHHRAYRTTMRITNVSHDGLAEPNFGSTYPRISGNGTRIVFSSYATNLVPDDTNGMWDIFVYTLATGETVRASLADDESEGNDSAVYSDVDRTGNLVAFATHSSNLVASDTNFRIDVFVRDLSAGTTHRIVGAGGEGDGDSTFPVIAQNGNVVGFATTAFNFFAPDAIWRDIAVAPIP